MKALRIAGKVLGWILVGLLILLAVFAFQGRYFPPAALGADFLMMAALMAIDASFMFKRPKRMTAEVVLHFKDGAIIQEQLACPAASGTIELGPEPLESIDLNVVEADEDE